MSLRSGLSAFVRAARVEYLPAAVPMLILPLLLSGRPPAEWFGLHYIIGTGVFLLLYISGFLANTVSDYSVDRLYASYKSGLPDAVDILGRKRAHATAGACVAAAVGLSLYLSLVRESPVPLLLVLLGVLFGIGYSAGPLHFKVKGLLHPVALASAAFLFPFLFLADMAGLALTPAVFMLALGFTMAQYALEFGNQAMDYEVDAAANLRTPPVRWGLRRTLLLSVVLAGAGMLLSVAALLVLLPPRPLVAGAPEWATVLLAAGVLAAGYILPLRVLILILRSGSRAGPGVRHASWQVAGALAHLAAVALLILPGLMPAPLPAPHPVVQNIAPRAVVAGMQDSMELRFPVSATSVAEFVVNQNEAAVFNGSNSFDPDGNITAYYWDLGDGARSVGPVATHTYKTLGNFTANLTVTDNGGAASSYTLSVRVVRLYIQSVDVRAYQDKYGNRKVNLTVTVMNDREERGQGELKLHIRYSNTLLFEDIAQNATLGPGDLWQSQASFDLYPFDPSPSFIVDLYKTSEGTLIDEKKTG